MRWLSFDFKILVFFVVETPWNRPRGILFSEFSSGRETLFSNFINFKFVSFQTNLACLKSYSIQFCSLSTRTSFQMIDCRLFMNYIDILLVFQWELKKIRVYDNLFWSYSTRKQITDVDKDCEKYFQCFYFKKGSS